MENSGNIFVSKNECDHEMNIFRLPQFQFSSHIHSHMLSHGFMCDIIIFRMHENVFKESFVSVNPY